VTASPYLELVDWRSRVAELFVAVRQRSHTNRRSSGVDIRKTRCSVTIRRVRSRASSVPTSAVLPAGRTTLGRVTARFVPLPEAESESPHTHNAGKEIAFRRIGHLTFELRRRTLGLPAFWISGYAGGFFIPSRDATSGHQTYRALCVCSATTGAVLSSTRVR
jgi:Protein of unknown function (DUF1684)